VNEGENENVYTLRLLARGLIRRQLGGGWYFTYNPIITANWNTSSGQRSLIPVGGGIGKRLRLGSQPVALSVHGYFNVIKSEGAPDGLVRVGFVLPIPRSFRR
jgi:hypothetical protein